MHLKVLYRSSGLYKLLNVLVVLLLALGVICSIAITVNPVRVKGEVTSVEGWEVIKLGSRFGSRFEDGVKVIEGLLRNDYVMLRIIKASNSTLSAALIKVEDYCPSCYPNNALSKEDRAIGKRLNAINGLINYVRGLWTDYAWFVRDKDLVTEAYVVPCRALTMGEFRELVERLGLEDLITLIYYSVYDVEGNYLMGGVVKVFNDLDQAIADIEVGVGNYSSIKSIDISKSAIYVGAFTVRVSLNKLMEVQGRTKELAFIYVPLDVMAYLDREGYEYIEVRYTAILEAVPECSICINS